LITHDGARRSQSSSPHRTYCFPNNSTDVVNQLWDVPAKGSSGLVKLHTKNFCFDAGSNPGNGIGMKIWQCYNGLFQQTWTYSNDNKLFLTNSTYRN
jgi:hypothetical protein